MKRKVVLGFSFGHRGEEPGLSNEVLAEAIKEFAPDVISVQWEIGKAIRKIGVEPNHEVKEHRQKGLYLDTEECARQMVEFLEQEGLLDEDIYTTAYQDHLRRCRKTLINRFGVTTKPMPIITEIPCDPKSYQWWTRSRRIFRLRERIFWPLYRLKGWV